MARRISEQALLMIEEYFDGTYPSNVILSGLWSDRLGISDDPLLSEERASDLMLDYLDLLREVEIPDNTYNSSRSSQNFIEFRFYNDQFAEWHRETQLPSPPEILTLRTTIIHTLDPVLIFSVNILQEEDRDYETLTDIRTRIEEEIARIELNRENEYNADLIKPFLVAFQEILAVFMSEEEDDDI